MKRVVSLILLLPFVFSCNSEEESQNPIDDGEPAITEVGIPMGPVVTKEIGPDGGSISSSDGKLDVTVPSGAVAVNTIFSIQPIISFCPGGIDAYDLLPEGVTFSNPVTLTFHYAEGELEEGSKDFSGIAFQGPDRIWYRMPSTIDEGAKTIVTKATHFTNWTRLSQLRIAPVSPAIPEIDVNESINLVLTGAGDINPVPRGVESPNPSGDDLPRLPQLVPFVATWYVNGVENGNANVGTISVSADRVNVAYHAPASPPANNPVAITAELNEFRAWDFINRRRTSFNRVILVKRVRITGPYDFHLKVELDNNDLACDPEQRYQDAAEMDLHVEDGVVTFSNFVNQDALITPRIFQTSNNCTLTCNGAGNGHLNVKSAEGSVVDAPSLRYLYITVSNRDLNGPGVKLECGGGVTSTDPKDLPDQSIPIAFILKDSTQIRTDVLKWTLTPQ